MSARAVHDGDDDCGAAGVKPLDAAALAPMVAAHRTALVVVDVQHDFVAPTGALAGAGIDVAPFAAPLAHIEALIDAARAAAVRVAWTRVVGHPDREPAVLSTLNARRGRPGETTAFCRAGRPGAAYHRVAPRAGEIEIEKPLYSGFHATALDEHLRAAEVDTLVFTGYTTECCVDTTVRDAFARGYHCFVVADACGGSAPHLHAAALETLAASFALVVTSAQVLAAWLPAMQAQGCASLTATASAAMPASPR